MPARRRLLFFLTLAGAAVALLWEWLRVWRSTPESGSSWIVLILLPYFVALRIRDRPASRAIQLDAVWWPVTLICGGLIGLTRLLLEPFPGWPLMEWIYASAIIGLSLLLIGVWQGGRMARHWAFPLGFALALLPWPTVVEADWIPRLRELLASVVAELCNLAGEPAIARGTVIQIGGAAIGIEEACGGIRSLQLAVLIALAAGELRRDRWRARCGWLLAAVSLALVGNGMRLFALTWIYGRIDAAAFSRWHDRLDWLEIAFLFCGLGALYIFAERSPAKAPPPGSEARPAWTGSRSAAALAWVILAILAGSEFSAWLWFRTPADSRSVASSWNARLARESPRYADDAFTPTMQSLLGCDVHQLGHWSDSGGARRAGYVVEWNRGQSARFTLLEHNPDLCLPYAGSQLVGVRPDVNVRCGDLELPFSCHEFSDGRGRFFVYYLAWNIAAGKPFGDSGERFVQGETWLRSQWREVAARRRSLPVRVMAVAIYDAPTGARADQAFQGEAARILRPGWHDVQPFGSLMPE